MHVAVAATEVVYYASRELLANAMHCKQQTTGPKGMRSLHASVRVVVVIVGNRQKKRELRVLEYSEQSVYRFPTLVVDDDDDAFNINPSTPCLGKRPQTPKLFPNLVGGEGFSFF